jgi:hypothetical protein
MEQIAPLYPAWMPILTAALLVWSIPWKAVALWRAARNGSLAWFVIMLVINTAAILEIIYIFGFSKKKVAQTKASQPA